MCSEIHERSGGRNYVLKLHGDAKTYGRHMGERRELLTGQVEPWTILVGVNARMRLDKVGPLFEKFGVPPTTI